MFTDLGKQKGLIFFGVLAFLVVVVIILVCCLDFNGAPSTGAELLASAPFVVGKSQWAKHLSNGFINNLSSEPWDIQGLTESSVDAQLYSIGALNCTSAQYRDAVAQTLDQIDIMLRVFDKYEKYFEPAVMASDINKARQRSKISGFLAIDGGYALDSRMSVLRDFYRSKSSDDPSTANETLDSFGESVIKEMNRLGILIDLTGSNEAIQLQSIRLSRAPVVFTSSSSYNLTENPMNVRDNVLSALKDNGGLVMISFTADQCCNSSVNCSIKNIVDHINHASSIAGRSSVGVGGDVGMGLGYPEGVLDSEVYMNLFDILLKSGTWTISELQGLAGNNFLRVMREVELVAKNMQQGGDKPSEIPFPLESIPDQACYSEITESNIRPRQLADALMNYQHKIQIAFQEAGGQNNTTPSAGGQNNTTPSAEGQNNTTPNAGGQNNTTTSAGGQNNTTPSAGGQNNTSPSAGGQNNTTPSAEGQNNTTPNAGGQNNTTTSAGGQNNTTPSAGGQNNTTPSAGGQNNTTPSAGGQNNTTPSAGAQNNTTPNSGGQNNTTPSAGGQNNTTPSAGGQNNTSPNAGGQNNTTPSAGGQNNTTPSAGGQNNTSPNAGGQNNTTPSAGGQNNTTPSAGGQNNTTPSAGGQNNTSPNAGGQNNTTPNAGGQNNTTPSAGGQNNTSPNAGGQNNTTPSAGGQNNTTPSAGGQNNTTPSAGGQNSTTPSAGGQNNTTPSSGGQNNTTPSAGGQNNTIPSAGGQNNTTPSAGGQDGNNVGWSISTFHSYFTTVLPIIVVSLSTIT